MDSFPDSKNFGGFRFGGLYEKKILGISYYFSSIGLSGFFRRIVLPLILFIFAPSPVGFGQTVHKKKCFPILQKMDQPLYRPSSQFLTFEFSISAVQAESFQSHS